MVTVSVYQEIQRCKRFGRSKAATARQLSLARGTVRKFWPMSERAYHEFSRQASRRRQRFDVYRDEIIEILEANAADSQKVYVSSIHDVLEERHGAVAGSGRTLRSYIRMLRETGAVSPEPATRVRRPQEEVAPGKQCQVDFGEYRIGPAMKAYIFVAVLAACRARYVRVQDHPFRTLEVITYLLESFAYFGGRPETLVIDQDKLMTVSENGGEIIHTKDFQHFLDEQELKVWLCRKADPQSKGKVENAVKFVKTSFFSARRFDEVEDIHEPLERWLARRANGRICQATGRVPMVVLETEERAKLRAVRSSIYDSPGGGFSDTRLADGKGMISFCGNQYSVPDEYAGHSVGVVPTVTHLMICDRDTGEQVACHCIPEGKGHICVAPHHRIPRGQKADETYEELAGRYAGDHWRAFVEGNRENYRRYWKDQIRMLERFLGTIDNHSAFDAALEFCLESSSYGAGDLRHAYRHLDEAGKLSLQPLLEHVKPIMAARRQAQPGVARRGVGYYSSLVSLVAGGAA